jgi:hypothetical protein
MGEIGIQTDDTLFVSLNLRGFFRQLGLVEKVLGILLIKAKCGKVVDEVANSFDKFGIQ